MVMWVITASNRHYKTQRNFRTQKQRRTKTQNRERDRLAMRKMEAKKEEIKKGPWKAEEDEVLINHVKRYGPRDWSSIRSKGLLQRTGKSCRLRWVNKLRPNLKKYTFFSFSLLLSLCKFNFGFVCFKFRVFCVCL